MYENAANYAEIEDFVEELARAGLRDVCISPGARSTPLALAMASHPALRAWSHIDERSGSFFALGMARGSRRPVAVLCTSGSAAANFHPAVVEASYGRVPLVVLTADRPPELREWGAPQAIDQIKMFGDHVKWFVEVGGADAGRRYFRALGARTVATALAAPPGPVHLNFPFREPLVPVPAASSGVPRAGGLAGAPARPDALPYTRAHASAAQITPALASELAEVLVGARRGLIACGPLDNDAATTDAVARLASLLGYPILADASSQLRSGPQDRSLVVDAYDAMLREPAFAERAAPETILCLGPRPTSKALATWLAAHPEWRQIVVDPFGSWNDPALVASDMVWGDPAAVCRALAERVSERAPRPDSRWLELWIGASSRVRAALDERLATMTELFEGRVFTELAALLPDGGTLYVGNSMPIRDLESFWSGGERRVRILCNRGANGIDGFVSSALGAAAAVDGPLVAVTGDLGLYHDLNGLLAARRHGVRATIVVLNNDGGGIFSYLPQAECGGGFEEYFLTPHGLDFRGAVEMYGCRFVRVASCDDLHDAIAAALDAATTTVVEVPVDRGRSVEMHRRLWAEVGAAALEGEA